MARSDKRKRIDGVLPLLYRQHQDGSYEKLKYKKGTTVRSWRDTTKMETAGSFTRSMPDLRPLFGTGAAKSLAALDDLLGATVSSSTGRDHLVRQLLVRNARRTMHYGANQDIVEPSVDGLRCINDANATLFALSDTDEYVPISNVCARLTAEEVKTYCFHEVPLMETARAGP